MAHIKPANDVIEFLVCYAVKGLKEAEKKFLEDGYQGNEKMEKVSAEYDCKCRICFKVRKV